MLTSPIWRYFSERLLRQVDIYSPPFADESRPPRELQRRLRPEAVLSTDELAILQDPSVNGSHPAWRPVSRPIAVEEAYKVLESKLTHGMTPTQFHAQERMLALYSRSRWKRSRIDLLKAFNDLDILLFHGVLRNRVHLQWIRHGKSQEGLIAWTAPPHSDINPSHRIRIDMTVEGAWYGYSAEWGRPDVWGTLIHEMLHAYLLIMSGRRCETCLCSAKTNRGPHFCAAKKTISNALAFGDLGPESIHVTKALCHWDGSSEELSYWVVAEDGCGRWKS